MNERQVRAWAEVCFKANLSNVYSGTFEGATVLAINRLGRTREFVVAGSEAEVEIPRLPRGYWLLATFHVHPGSGPELSAWDEEFGRNTVKESGKPYYSFVAGLDDDGNAVMTSEVFEP